MKKNIAFLVERDFISAHVGIRNYVFSISSILNQIYNVDIIATHHFGNNLFFSRLQVHPSFIKNNGFTTDLYIEVRGKKNFSLKKVLPKFCKTKNDGIVSEIYYQSLGQNIDDLYDAVIITNPWMINFTKTIKCKTLIGLVHDTIPIEYCFQSNVNIQDSALIKFANLHRNGFDYYNRNCNFIIFSSKKSLDGYNILYGPDVAGRRKVMSPHVSEKFYNQDLNDTSEAKKEYLVLPTPFEKRKGIDYIPDIINKTKNIKKIFIFGDSNRCSIKEINNFFSRLRDDFEIIWYKNITSDVLISFLRKSKLMLFASKDEGLGLPIIEAELCGCKVICYDIAPMNLSMVDNMKYYLLPSHEDSAKLIDDIFHEEDDSIITAKNANIMFDQQRVLDLFVGLLN